MMKIMSSGVTERRKLIFLYEKSPFVFKNWGHFFKSLFKKFKFLTVTLTNCATLFYVTLINDLLFLQLNLKMAYFSAFGNQKKRKSFSEVVKKLWRFNVRITVYTMHLQCVCIYVKNNSKISWRNEFWFWIRIFNASKKSISI